MNNRLCVVIVNYKTAGLVRDCLQTLVPQLDVLQDKVIIVDNDSGPNEAHLLEKYLFDYLDNDFVKLINSGKNGGFSFGNNRGIKACKASFYLLTNSDTLFLPGAVDALLKAKKEYPDAGLIGPRLEWPDALPQVSCFRYPSPLSEIIRSAHTGVVTRILQSFNVPLVPVTSVLSPDWISFACVLIGGDVFDSCGFLDEGFFMYYEDVDMCRRARAAGYSIICCPESRVIHLQGKSSEFDQLSAAKKKLPDFYYHARSRYFKKFYGTIGFYTANLLWYTGRLFSLVRQIFGMPRPVPLGESRLIWSQKTYNETLGKD